MNFREFLETVVWPRLTPEERKALQDSPQVEFYDEEQRKAYLISATNQEGKILDARGNLLESGLQMFVLGIDNSLYMGKKIKGIFLFPLPVLSFPFRFLFPLLQFSLPILVFFSCRGATSHFLLGSC